MKKKFPKKVSQCRKKPKGDPLASSGIVCYAGNLFGSVPCVQFGAFLKFCRTFGLELFWSLQVYRKKLTKSHDYSRLFSVEKRRRKHSVPIHTNMNAKRAKNVMELASPWAESFHKLAKSP